MLWWSTTVLVFVLALASPAAAAPPAMRTTEWNSSVELDALARGRLRLWLGTQIQICESEAKQQDLQGALKIHLDIAPKHIDVKVTPSGKIKKAVAACLTRNLRKVGFADLAPSFTWDGAFQFDANGPSIEVNVQSLYGKLYGFVAESVVMAAIDQPADCMTKFFTADPVMSAVLIVTFDADGAHVKESTADPGGAVDCVTSLLAPITWPSELLRGAKLRVALLRPTAIEPNDASINVITADPPSPPSARMK